MTRDDFKSKMSNLSCHLDYPTVVILHDIDDHDAEQRRVIEGLSAKVKKLTKWSDVMFGTPCEEIRHQQQVEALEEKIEQQAQQIATLREVLKGIVTNIDVMSDRSLLLVQTRSAAQQALKKIKS